jgi:hypothetical protein
MFKINISITSNTDFFINNKAFINSFLIKNLIQNANGSLEIRWGAIDYNAKKQIKKYLDHSKDWRTPQNSTNGIYFEKTQRASTIENANLLLKEARLYVENFNVKGFLAKMYVMGYSYFGTYYVITTILPYSITANPLCIASSICGISEAELLEDETAYQQEVSQREAERAERHTKIANAQEQAETAVQHLKKEQISTDTNKVYVAPTVTTTNLPAFRFYQVVGKGTFGRVIVNSYVFNKLEVKPELFKPINNGKQLKISDITTKQTYLLK